MIRCIIRLAITVLVAAFSVNAGCGKTPSSNDDPPSAGTPAAEPTYETHEELLGWLKTLETGEDRLAMIDLVHTETETERMTTRYMRSIDKARMEYARAINEAFAADGEKIMADDLGMRAFHEAMQSADVEQVSPVRVRVTCTPENGEEQILILERWGTWQLHVSTLRNGEDVNAVWYSMQQGRFGGLLKYHRDVTEQIRAGAFDSAEEAQARLDELLAGRMPPLGSVPPD
ncbi:MAG: hypothetical protein SYC29_15640 [Planctomycetota bacterium]|nr:hypothetical protein [Planctomycetota bacterium]